MWGAAAGADLDALSLKSVTATVARGGAIHVGCWWRVPCGILEWKFSTQLLKLLQEEISTRGLMTTATTVLPLPPTAERRPSSQLGATEASSSSMKTTWSVMHMRASLREDLPTRERGPKLATPQVAHFPTATRPPSSDGQAETVEKRTKDPIAFIFLVLGSFL